MDLDAKSNRVTLKIDVPYAEHSHVIGKEGANIKRSQLIVISSAGSPLEKEDSLLSFVLILNYA